MASLRLGLRSGMLIAMAAVFLVGSGAVIGAGTAFYLGQSNSSSTTTTLKGSTAGRELQVTNNSTNAAAAGLGISVTAGRPPIVVTSTTGTPGRAIGLDADKLDGIDSTGFVRSTAGSVSTTELAAGSVTSAKLSTQAFTSWRWSAVPSSSFHTLHAGPMFINFFCLSGSGGSSRLTAVVFDDSTATGSATFNAELVTLAATPVAHDFGSGIGAIGWTWSNDLPNSTGTYIFDSPTGTVSGTFTAYSDSSVCSFTATAMVITSAPQE